MILARLDDLHCSGVGLPEDVTVSFVHWAQPATSPGDEILVGVVGTRMPAWSGAARTSGYRSPCAGRRI
jgi:hypothetical protein